MMIDPETKEALTYAAIAALHKQLRSVAEVRLTEADFNWHDANQDDAIQLKFDHETGDIILRHVKRQHDA